ncbi:GNAT family N-acetyltransferase [Candidatus Leptofilum sp.]|uniref:GNAT family N-acetyltransferase n=1 Tax=Candidatus Leptofilum sp. TaxID=3241576 RepID=UPI003B5A0BAB
MELANLWLPDQARIEGIRQAKKSDAEAVLHLLKTAVYTHLHVDWYLPGDWIGSPGFLVLPKQATKQNSLAAKLFQTGSDIDACLIATPDPLPAAWVRTVAIHKATNAKETLANLLLNVLPVLRQQGVTQLAWLPVETWPSEWLPEWGFCRGSEIETYIKEDRELPALPNVPGLTIRQVQSTDYDALAALEAVSFAPIWRQSARALAVARSQSLSFDVALLDGDVVGYQLSARAEAGAHLVRLTVHPKKQGLGIGTALLRHAFTYYYRRGLYTVSLNTQIENGNSQKLYQRFGFEPTQQRLPIWVLDIA